MSGSVSMPSGETSSSRRPPLAKPAIRAVAPTKLGNTSGSGESTRQARRPGRSVRMVSHANPVPITAEESDTTTPSHSDRRSGSHVSRDHRRDSEDQGHGPSSVPRSMLRHTT